ncbi:MAG: DUF3488 domain-containing protein [Phycisphaera sp.]|nr:DUF3488 domain-containing protein [Phycisphaera sp.]
MNLIFLFRRLVFAQVLMGIVSFCMAERNPGMLLVAGALAAMSWYLTEGPTGRPLPKWIVNLGALGAVGWLVFDLFHYQGELILAMGHFTMWLQVVLLYSRKSNREYAQVMVLSLLLMIGAAVMPGGVTMIFGLLLVAYCVLTLFALLVFHLKLVSDQVMEFNQLAAAVGVRVARSKVVVGRGSRGHFRTTAGFIGIACASIAVFVFIVLPRSAEGQQRAVMQSMQPTTAGFNDEVRLDRDAPTSGSREVVLSVSIKRNGRSIGDDDRSFLLRGAVLDQYSVPDKRWSRSSQAGFNDRSIELDEHGIDLAVVPDDTPTIEADFTLRRVYHGALISLYPVTRFDSVNLTNVLFNPDDQTLNITDPSSGAAAYSTRSAVQPYPGLLDSYRQQTDKLGLPRFVGSGERGFFPLGGNLPQQDSSIARCRVWPASAARVRRLTLDVIRRAGLDRELSPTTTPDDRRIAQVVRDYLCDNYTYSLHNPPTSERDDPVVEFLFKNRQGHCELFAAGYAAMLRSIGIPVRLVTGYRASEYNAIGGYYVVYPTNAHAWNEVYCGDEGWVEFDATPPDLVAQEHHVNRTFFTSLREVYQHMEFLWISTVIAYDARTRTAVLNNVDRSIRSITTDRGTTLRSVYQWVVDFFREFRFDSLSISLIAFILVFILVGVFSLIRTLMVRRQRLVALRLTQLPRSQRHSLAKRLRFYLQMLDILERHGHHREPWQTPAAFAQQLAYADPMRFDPVVLLTEQFYEVRFGYRQIDDRRRKLIRAHLKQLEHALVHGT